MLFSVPLSFGIIRSIQTLRRQCETKGIVDKCPGKSEDDAAKGDVREVHEYENTAEDRPDYKHVASTASYVGARTHEPDASLRKRDGVAVAAFEDGVLLKGRGMPVWRYFCIPACKQ